MKTPKIPSAWYTTNRPLFTLSKFSLFILITVFVFCIWALELLTKPTPKTQKNPSYIIRGADVETVKTLVEQVGGIVTHKFFIIDSVMAELSLDQKQQLESHPEVKKVMLEYKVIEEQK
mgnify:CR=1 FL=1